MELKAFNIQFDYISCQNNILVDTLSCLVDINPDTPLTPEGQGYEFGYAIFEEFPKVKTKTYEVNEVIVGTDKRSRVTLIYETPYSALTTQLCLTSQNAYNNKMPT